ncbi:MAG: ATP-binding protein [Candidatus Omnitrophica bacterium]|nr:ATP-binding protein [Candidatus Omnitrophota bacterium]MBI3021037.1 ATP-binding protein [Candidatus Omnitrophota bacterium]
MYPRVIQPSRQSFFLFGPRGVGKTAWLHRQFRDALFFDLLDHAVYTELLAAPQRLGDRIPHGHRNWVVVDEVQRVPELLNEVHRLIESRRLRFVLTGSSARKLRGRGVNLLAGRALTRHMHPLTAVELGKHFDLQRALRYGCLPLACTSRNPQAYLQSYTATYLREEVQQEGFARNIGAFSRFLEAASFSQGSVLNMAAVARDCAISAKVVEDYFSILEDLLIAIRLPVFAKRAKRRLITHPKFYYFDAGVFQAVRPRGPLDAPEQIHGAALETLFLQQVRAINDYGDLGYRLHFWRTATGDEVDFVLYGERGLRAFEVTMADRIRHDDLSGLRRFREDFPQAKVFLLYLGRRRWHDRGVDVVPFLDCVTTLHQWV